MLTALIDGEKEDSGQRAVDATLPDGRTALILAAEGGHIAAVRVLLELGGMAKDAKARDAAIARRESELVRLLTP